MDVSRQDPQFAIRVRGVSKVFPGVVANDAVDLDIFAGEVHAIVGENGAGKSTLMKMLCGLYRPDGGTMEVAGCEVHFANPREAVRRGIGMVHQHFMLVDRFTVLDNIILGSEPVKYGTVMRDEAASKVQELSSQYGFELDLGTRVEALSVGEKQRVEILKVLYRGAEVIIMDEPTAVLVPQEVEELISNLRRLAAGGKTIVFISHKLDEVLQVADRITVLRQGVKIGTVAAGETSKAELAEMMVGRPVLFAAERKDKQAGAPVLSITNVSLVSGKRSVLRNVSLQVRRGEIYGIAGVQGNGQTELLEIVVGLRRPDSGQVVSDGEDIAGRGVAEVRRRGIAFIPEDRHRRGLVLDMRVWENLFLGQHRLPQNQSGLFMNHSRLRSESERRVAEYDVRVPSVETPLEELSGGNQQKVIVARELSSDPGVVIAAQPTRGLDVGAIEFVHKQLLAARDAGLGVLLVSADLDELFQLSDRIGVMYRGRLVAEFEARSITARELGRYMLGEADQGPGGDANG